MNGNRLDSRFGAEGTGLDLSRPLDPAIRSKIDTIFVDNVVLCFRGQSFGRPEAFVRAVENLGRPMPLRRSTATMRTAISPGSSTATDGSPATCWSGTTGARCTRRPSTSTSRGDATCTESCCEAIGRCWPYEENAATRACLASTPVRRIGTPDDIAELTHFMLSDAADFITGRIRVASGGLVTLP